MTAAKEIFIGVSPDGKALGIRPEMANRHGLIAGATGTGKTVTLQRLAEEFSRQGVCVFTADVKGDLSGLACAGASSPKLIERIRKLGLEEPRYEASPVIFWDVFGERGHPVRTTISEMGPLLLGELLELNSTQQAALEIAYRYADEEGLILADLKDLMALLAAISEHSAELRPRLGNITPQTIGSIQRGLIQLDQARGETFFGEPVLQLAHLMNRDLSGRGVIHILDATKLLVSPRVYTTFLLWLLSELFEQLPECGDLPQPKLVFFFDEAHLLFNDAPRALLEKIELVVRLIRSKGVGVYFVTQNPSDVPDSILGQLGNRIQHALRAFTPRDQKAIRVAAETFATNPKLDVEQVITTLGVGEALVSVLDQTGSPTPVERALIAPPSSRIGAITDQERAEVIARSPYGLHYAKEIDRESAYEQLRSRHQSESKADKPSKWELGTIAESFIKSAMRSIGSSLGRQIARGVLGSILGKK